MANKAFANKGHFFAPEVKPVLLNCNFVVDSANGNGLGIRNLKGSYIKNVFMHTSAPLAGSGNPNPAVGTIVIQLADNYARYLGGFTGNVSVLSGSSLKVDAIDAALTPGVAYVITILGDATAADWLALGVPAGVTAAVGVSFIALVTGSGVASVSRVQSAVATGVTTLEAVGNPNLSSYPQGIANVGAWLIFHAYTGAGALVTPPDGAVISMSFYMSDSSVQVQGE